VISMGGCVGGSVGGGGSVGVSGGGSVGIMITDVFVGTIGGVLEVGRGNAVGVSVGPATLVRAVKVGSNVGVGLGVRVTVGVAVGRVGVKVGVSEAVGVGAVEVGKGPRRDSAVSARAVFVLMAFCRAAASGGCLNTSR
jgi:hypothetical protein